MRRPDTSQSLVSASRPAAASTDDWSPAGRPYDIRFADGSFAAVAAEILEKACCGPRSDAVELANGGVEDPVWAGSSVGQSNRPATAATPRTVKLKARNRKSEKGGLGGLGAWVVWVPLT